MVDFIYRAKDNLGNTKQGVIEAEDESSAIESLSTKDLNILSLTPKSGPTTPSKPTTVREEESVKKVKLGELITFITRFADLMDAGVSLLHALNLLRRQMKEKSSMRIIAHHLYKDVEGGVSFSKAWLKFKHAVPSILPPLIASGEGSGNLDTTLREAAKVFEKRKELINKVKMATIYPATVAVMGVVTVFVLLSFVVPKIGDLYKDLDQTLPLLTTMLLVISNAFAHYWWLIILFIVGLVFVIKNLLKNPEYRLTFDRWRLDIPVIKDLIKQTEIATFARTLGMMLKSGVPILEAIKSTAPVLNTEIYKREVKGMSSDIKGGKFLSKAMSRNEDLFPPFAIDICAVGEKGGKLDESLMKLADSYERRTEYTIKIMTQFLEPLLILTVGLMIGFIVISMLLPIFNISTIIE